MDGGGKSFITRKVGVVMNGTKIIAGTVVFFFHLWNIETYYL